MDFYQILAMKVFSELGHLIEEDEKNQLKITSLNSDIMQKIGSYLLEDKNKTIHKIFKNRPDDDLQLLLFGEVKDLTYVNIYSSDNEIDYKMNDKLKNYVNFILKAKGIKSNCEKMKLNFYIETKHFKRSFMDYRKIRIVFYNEEDKQIATIENNYYYLGGSCNYTLSYRHNNTWKTQNIKKKDITDEFDSIEQELYYKYF
jgi:hypothetical protein